VRVAGGRVNMRTCMAPISSLSPTLSFAIDFSQETGYTHLGSLFTRGSKASQATVFTAWYS
jgi:hypothetical protein